MCVLWFLPPANPHPLLSSATQANTGMLQNSGAVQYSTGTSNTHSIHEVWQYPWCKAYWGSQHSGANLLIGAQQQQGLSRHQDGFVHLWVATNHPQVYFPFDVSSSTLQFRLLSLYLFILDAHEMHMYKSRTTCVHWWVGSFRPNYSKQQQNKLARLKATLV